MVVFCLCRPQEFTAGRNVIKEIADLDYCARRNTGLAHILNFTGRHSDFRADYAVGRPGLHTEA